VYCKLGGNVVSRLVDIESFEREHIRNPPTWMRHPASESGVMQSAPQENRTATSRTHRPLSDVDGFIVGVWDDVEGFMSRHSKGPTAFSRGLFSCCHNARALLRSGIFQAHMPRMRVFRSIGAVMIERVVERS
jgi:hypothetical protein